MKAAQLRFQKLGKRLKNCNFSHPRELLGNGYDDPGDSTTEAIRACTKDQRVYGLLISQLAESQNSKQKAGAGRHARLCFPCNTLQDAEMFLHSALMGACYKGVLLECIRIPTAFSYPFSL